MKHQTITETQQQAEIFFFLSQTDELIMEEYIFGGLKSDSPITLDELAEASRVDNYRVLNKCYGPGLGGTDGRYFSLTDAGAEVKLAALEADKHRYVTAKLYMVLTPDGYRPSDPDCFMARIGGEAYNGGELEYIQKTTDMILGLPADRPDEKAMRAEAALGDDTLLLDAKRALDAAFSSYGGEGPAVSGKEFSSGSELVLKPECEAAVPLTLFLLARNLISRRAYRALLAKAGEYLA